MEKRQLHRLPVLNRQKRMVGILSLGDIALHAPNRLAGEVAEAVSRASELGKSQARATAEPAGVVPSPSIPPARPGPTP